MIAQACVEVALIFVQHFEGKIVVDRSDAESAGQLGREAPPESMRVGSEDAADAARLGTVITVGAMLKAEEDVVDHPVRTFLEGVIGIDAGRIGVAFEGVGGLVHLPDRHLGIGEKQVPILASGILQCVEFQTDLEGEVVGVPVRPGVEGQSRRDVILLENAEHGLICHGPESGRGQEGKAVTCMANNSSPSNQLVVIHDGKNFCDGLGMKLFEYLILMRFNGVD